VSELRIPAEFTRHVHEVLQGTAREWLATVPRLAAGYARKWDLTFDGEPRHGFVAVVQPARRADGTPVMLKLGWPHEESADEPLALSTWAGQGAVLLAESAPADGVLLLERLDDDRMLHGEPIGAAVEIAAGLMRRLAVPAPPGLTRSMRAEAERLAGGMHRWWADLGEPFARKFVDAAVAACHELGPAAGNLLVNEDLHYENVLAGAREPWLVIDPKPIAGDLEYGVMSLLWNRIGESTLDERAAVITAVAGLEPQRVRGWTLIRSVANWLWSLEGGEDRRPDPATTSMSRIAAWAAGERTG
jgi:streptomycin 6-kinase